MTEDEYCAMRDAVRAILRMPGLPDTVVRAAARIELQLDLIIQRLAFDPKPADPARHPAPDAP